MLSQGCQVPQIAKWNYNLILLRKNGTLKLGRQTNCNLFLNQWEMCIQNLHMLAKKIKLFTVQLMICIRLNTPHLPSSSFLFIYPKTLLNLFFFDFAEGIFKTKLKSKLWVDRLRDGLSYHMAKDRGKWKLLLLLVCLLSWVENPN